MYCETGFRNVNDAEITQTPPPLTYSIQRLHRFIFFFAHNISMARRNASLLVTITMANNNKLIRHSKIETKASE